MSNLPPKDVYIGTVPSEWPLHIFEQQGHAIRWMENAENKGLNPHLWKCRIEIEQEMVVLPPSAPRLVPKYEDYS